MMYNNYRFEKNARRRRTKAVVFTALFHLLLIAGVAWAGNADLKEMIPETVQEWLGAEAEEAPDAEISKPQP